MEIALESRDLTIFNVLTGLAAVHFLLKTKGTVMEGATWMYVLMWVLSVVMLLWLRVYGGRSGEQGDLVDYDENLEAHHFPILIGSVVVIILLSSLVVSSFTKSSIYIPLPSALLSEAPGSTAAVLDDLLYNFVLVAPAEENIKLMTTLALWRKFKNEILAICLPIGVWAALHAYQAYLGALMPVLVISAFVSRLVLFAVLKYTSSLENAILSHGLYNSLVVVASAFHLI